MKKTPDFYNKLDEKGKKHYDVQEARRPHTNKFIELIEQKRPSEGAIKGLLYTEEELELLGKEDLVTLGNVHPTEADYYMFLD